MEQGRKDVNKKRTDTLEVNKEKCCVWGEKKWV